MNDEQLLEQLGSALFTDPDVEPSMALRAALRRAVSGPASIAPRHRHRLLIGLAVGVSSLAVSTTAFAVSGAPLPPVVRQVAYAARLPVDSPDMADARYSRRTLRNAITSNDTAQIAVATRGLLADLDKLDAGERDALQPEADQLLRLADEHAQSGANPNEPQGDRGSNGPAGQSDHQPTGVDGQQTGPGESQVQTDEPAGDGSGPERGQRSEPAGAREPERTGQRQKQFLTRSSRVS